jgi:flagellar basal-body rod modification protein FlgD
MAVSATGSATAAGTGAAPGTAAPKAAADYQYFLKLLVAQMKNQDPTNPADPTQYVAQLATFSQVEQALQTNTKLDRLLQASALSQAGAVVGRTITSADGTVTGTAKEVKLGAGGLVAVLSSGSEVAIGPGIVIGGTAP